MIQNLFGSLISVFLWVPRILIGLLFAHHKKFWGFFEMSLDVCWHFDGFADHKFRVFVSKLESQFIRDIAYISM